MKPENIKWNVQLKMKAPTVIYSKHKIQSKSSSISILVRTYPLSCYRYVTTSYLVYLYDDLW